MDKKNVLPRKQLLHSLKGMNTINTDSIVVLFTVIGSYDEITGKVREKREIPYIIGGVKQL